MLMQFKEPADPTQVSYGDYVVLGCSDSDLDLEFSWLGYSRECFNNDFRVSDKGASYPPLEACIVPEPCLTSQLPLLGAPYHVEPTVDVINVVTSVAHGHSVDYACKDGRRMDTQSDNRLSVNCNAGVLEAEADFPEEDECRAVCTALTVPVGSGFAALGVIDVVEREFITLTCDDVSHHVDDFWNSTHYKLECLADSTFDEPDVWPVCGPRPSCGNPPAAPPAAAMDPVNPNATPEVNEFVTYECTDPTKVTTRGLSIEVRCGMGDTSPEYDFPAEWGTGTMQCRDAAMCSDPPTPPVNSGLVMVVEVNVTGYVEYDTVNYTCETAGHTMYLNNAVYGDVFQATCLPPGHFEDVEWPYCETATNPPTCSVFPEVPVGIPVSIVEQVPVLRDAWVEYKCDDDSMTTNIGKIVKVPCEKDWTTGQLAFKTPTGWEQMECRTDIYPNFEPEVKCYCLGDRGLTPQMRKDMLDKVCTIDYTSPEEIETDYIRKFFKVKLIISLKSFK